MLKIKLTRLGKNNEPHYRIVVAEEHSKLTGSAKAVLGHYHPLEKSLTVDKEAVKEWMGKGAQPTSTVRKLLGLH
jgi:small subunit ribosomal protein S16